MMNNIKDTERRQQVLWATQNAFEWDKWMNEIPYLEFPTGWQVKAVPPIAVGIIRYHIKHADIPGSLVSIYLDCYDMVGIMGKPYWEIYPVDGQNNLRCDMNDTKQLIEIVTRAFEQQRLSNKSDK